MPPFAKNTTHTTQRGPSDATCPGLAALCRLGSESHLGAGSTRLRSTRPGGMSVAQAASSIEDTPDLLLEAVSPSFRSSEISLPCIAFPWSSPGLTVVGACELRHVAESWPCCDNAGRGCGERPDGRPVFRPFYRKYGARPRWGRVRCWLHSIPAPISLLCRHPLQDYAVTRYKRYAATDWAGKISSAPKACSGKA
jgi:hypothetical protein